MMYEASNQIIPQDSRKEINDKILHLIETNDMQGITPTDVYNAFTGQGGLHGLDFKNYGSFYSYTEAKKELENGAFHTPHDTSKQVTELLKVQPSDLVADLTCGSGSFFNFMPTPSNVYGCELNSQSVRVAKFLYPKANIVCDDIRNYNPSVKFDSVIINPPFNLRFGDMSSQMYVCKKAAETMKPLSLMALIVPKSFLNDEMMDKKDIERMNDFFNFVGQYELSKTEFKQMGVSSFETKVMFFQRKSEFVDNIPFVNVFTTTDYIENQIGNLRAVKSSLRAKTMSEIDSDDSTFNFKVKKYLYEFKTHKKLQHYSSKAEALLNKFRTQKRPEKMEQKEWDKIKLTESKVLSVFKRVMKTSYIVETNTVRLVKRRGDFKIKSYSTKMKNDIEKRTVKTIADIHLLLSVNGEYESFLNTCKALELDTNEMQKVMRKRQKDYLVHNTPIKDLSVTKDIKNFVSRFTFISKGKKCKLNDIQKLDISKLLTRKHTLLGWQMGCGKSVALLCVIKYLQKYNLTKNVFITAPAIAIDLTLKNMLRSNGVDFVDVLKAKQLKNIKDGQVLIMTLGRLSGAKKEVKEFVKSRSNKVSLIFDESDEIKNRLSKRSKGVLNAFRRCHKTLLMTGTPTRNNLNEIYPNLELMYNNSSNMMCNVDKIYKQDKKSKEIKSHVNKINNKPFDAYFGFGLFKNCFSPTKASVFGIQKNSQSVYNMDSLKSFIERSLIIRTSEEVMGKKSELISHFVKPNSDERELQQTILTEFHSICYNYFHSTGNGRKESYLKIIRMINLLIKSCTAPHLMGEWNGQGLPTKYTKVIKMIEERPNEIIMVGCVGIESSIDYKNVIERRFPNRKVYYVDGTVNFKKREAIVNEFNDSKNAILVSNQAALKSSVSIEKCDTVLVPSLPWNYASLSQYFCRAARFDSNNITEVHLICYMDSIDLNILQLLLNKEKVNNFLKTCEVSTDEDVNEEFGIDGDMLSNVIQKYKDDENGTSFMIGEGSTERVA